MNRTGLGIGAVIAKPLIANILNKAPAREIFLLMDSGGIMNHEGN